MLASEESRALAALRFSLASDIVELVVLTADEVFLQTLREAVGPARRLWHVLSSDKVSDLLVAGGVGILVLDVPALNQTAARFVADIKHQFPDLVIVAAGNRESETDLARLISDGSIYRFIHKPVSPARARLFAEAAVKRFDEQRKRAPEPPAPAPAPPRSAGLLIGAGAGAIALVLLAGWLVHLGNREPPSADIAPPRPAAPPAAPSPAAPLPDAPAVPGVLVGAQERLLARARAALDQQRLDEAATAIEAARRAGINTSRVAQLATELARERAKAPSAETTAPSRRPAPSAPAPAAPPVAEAARGPVAARAAGAATGAAAPAGLASPNEGAANRSAVLAMERIAEGRLLEPENDDARWYVEQALKTDSAGEGAQRAAQALSAALLAAAREALARPDFAPDHDQAQPYLSALRNLDPRNPGLADLTEELGARLVSQARTRVNAQQYEAARALLDHAAALGYVSPQAEGVRRDLDAALAQRALMSNLISASQLVLVKSVQPRYPPKAENGGVEGWVDLNFTVTDTGRVEDVVVRDAKPAGVFEAAAREALLQWRYQPLVRDGKEVSARAQLRIRFTLPH